MATCRFTTTRSRLAAVLPHTVILSGAVGAVELLRSKSAKRNLVGQNFDFGFACAQDDSVVVRHGRKATEL
ncbi:MAG: hypothetical protein IJB19_08020 [Clostridia bacterium]|nr:hypothetical protein [Clostridia bacterium]